MKKILTLLLLLVSFSIGARAQFEQDTHYVNASFSNFGINYNDRGGFRLGMNAEGGYFFEDNWMLHGTVGFNHYGYRSNEVNLGAGVRYYFSSNGISLGTGLEYIHRSPNQNDLRLPFTVGYTFYLNHYIAIEPQVFYKLSINDFSQGSEVGTRIGLGFYF